MATASGPDLSAALRDSVVRTRIVGEVAMVLGTSPSIAEDVVAAFDRFVAEPLRERLRTLTGRDLARRNPMIYTARGIGDVETWVIKVLDDKETSALEAHLGTWQEEVARIISGGVKPAGGVDLQIEDDGGVVHLYAIQTAPNTKNAGGRRSDIDALKRCAAPLRSARRVVELNVAVLHGRTRSTDLASEPGIRMLGSDEFWTRISGTNDFRPRLLRATTLLAELVHERSADDVARIRAEAAAMFDDGTGGLDMDALANPPRRVRMDIPTQLALLDDS